MKNWVLKNYAAGQSWVDLGTYPDKNGKKDFFGFFYRVNVKSLVSVSYTHLTLPTIYSV